LRVVVKLMSLVALLAFVWVLFGSLPQRSPGEIETTRFNVADMQPGDYRLVEWQKKPLYIVYRKPEWESALQTAPADQYRDPDSRYSSQPDSAVNALRSATPGWFVTLGLGTGLGCTLAFTAPADGASVAGFDASGGFTDGCDQSRYDLSGRILTGMQASKNTVIPPWSLQGAEILIGGQLYH